MTFIFSCEVTIIQAFISTAVPILIFILILGIVVFIHELGHYIMARRAGVFVEEFALGMGPKLLGFKGKPMKNQAKAEPVSWSSSPDYIPEEAEPDATLYSLRLFPIGGFCKMRGADESIPDDPTALNNKTIPQRMFVMVGGSLFNFIMAFVLFFVLVLLDGYSVPQVHRTIPETPAYHAGLVPGDRITHIDGRRVALFEDLVTHLEFSGGQPLDVRFTRDGERHNVTMTPMWSERQERFIFGFDMVGYVGLLGEVHEGQQRVGFWGTFVTSAEMIRFNLRMPFTLLARLIAGNDMPDGVGVMGPIGMGGEVVAIYQQVAARGFLPTLLTMLFFTALLNAALGIMNLLPIPALDGARLVFLGIEGIRRKPVSPEREGLVHLIGFIVLILVAVFVAYRDIVRLL